MSHWTSLFLFGVLFLSSASLDPTTLYANRTMTSSRSIYDLVQLRRMASRLSAQSNRTRPNSTDANAIDRPANSRSSYGDEDVPNAFKSSKEQLKDIRHQFFVERLRVMIITSVIAVSLMTAIVIICISVRYLQTRHQKPMESAEQRVPLKPQRQISQKTPFSLTSQDRRNFSRKPRASERVV